MKALNDNSHVPDRLYNYLEEFNSENEYDLIESLFNTTKLDDLEGWEFYRLLKTAMGMDIHEWVDN